MSNPRPVGRPPGKIHDRTYAIRMPTHLYAVICRLADRDGIKPSAWIRRCVERAVKRRKLPEEPPV